MGPPPIFARFGVLGPGVLADCHHAHGLTRVLAHGHHGEGFNHTERKEHIERMDILIGWWMCEHAPRCGDAFSAVPSGLGDVGSGPGSELPGYCRAVPPGLRSGRFSDGVIADCQQREDGAVLGQTQVSAPAGYQASSSSSVTSQKSL
ncbi:MAG: hypothetical protein JWR26_435 [Pedosphaera sp.]|nr:hypothetical protein [Pedosphaera sp.]